MKFFITFIILTLFQKNNTMIRPTKTKGRFWSLITGYTSFVIHAGGQPISFYLLPQKLNKTVYIGTITLAFLIINSIKLIPYYLLNQLIISNLKISLILLIDTISIPVDKLFFIFSFYNIY